MNKKCILYDRECDDCQECQMCDLNPDKVCDNCGKCIDPKEEYAKIIIDEIVE